MHWKTYCFLLHCIQHAPVLQVRIILLISPPALFSLPTISLNKFVQTTHFRNPNNLVQSSIERKGNMVKTLTQLILVLLLSVHKPSLSPFMQSLAKHWVCNTENFNLCIFIHLPKLWVLVRQPVTCQSGGASASSLQKCFTFWHDGILSPQFNSSSCNFVKWTPRGRRTLMAPQCLCRKCKSGQASAISLGENISPHKVLRKEHMKDRDRRTPEKIWDQ